MAFIDRFRHALRLHHLIISKATGDPEALARRLELSRSAVYRLLDDLANLGAEVQYSPAHKSFVYAEEVKFDFKVCRSCKDSSDASGGGDPTAQPMNLKKRRKRFKKTSSE